MIRIRYEDIPVGVNDLATFSSTNGSNITTLKTDTSTVKYATLEKNLWKLDGSFTVPTPNIKSYYWSKYVSDENGIYDIKPTIKIVLSSPVSTTGLTLYFDEEMYTFKINYLMDNIPVLQHTYTATQYNYVATDYVRAWNNLEIEFIRSTTPNRFVKIKEIVIGQIINFEPNELTEANLVTEVNPISAELAIDTFDFKLKDKFNRTFQFQNKQKMYVYQNDQLVGLYYVDNSVRNSTTDYDVTCIDGVGILDTANYFGGIYNNISAKELIQDIIGTDIEVDYTNVEGLTLSGYLPIGKKREALNQIALALGVAVTTYKREKLTFIKLEEITEVTVNRDRIFQDGSVSTAQKVSSVQVTSHTYTLSNTSEQVYKGYIDGYATITLSTPHSNYTITGGTIVNSGANFVSVSATGEVVITGTKYDDNTVIYQKTNPTTLATDKSNIIEIKDATLISDDNAVKILNNVYNYYLYLDTISQKILVNDERPGQRITTENAFGTGVQGYITKMNMKFTHNTYADITIVGEEIGLKGVAPYTTEVYAGEIAWLQQ